MHAIVYVSSAKQLLPEEELLDILARSRRNNATLGITGYLTYYDGNFAQLIEGDREPVELTFERIKADYRHSQIKLLHNAPSKQRIFPDWRMGFRTLNSRRDTKNVEDDIRLALANVMHLPDTLLPASLLRSVVSSMAPRFREFSA